VTRLSGVTSSCVLWSALRERTATLGDLAAVAAPGAELSFAALWRQAERFAKALLAAGVRESSVVGLSLPNSDRFVAALLALWRIDATVALLSPQYGRTELGPIVSRAGVGCIVTDVAGVERISAAQQIVRDASAAGLRALFTGAAPVTHAGTLLKFSSGSMAEPKGIVLDAGNVLSEAENVQATLALDAGDRIFADVSLSHSYGLDCGVMQTLYSGTTLVLDDTLSPRRRLATLETADVFLGAPSHYRVFLASASASPPDLTRVRWLLSCTAPLGVDVVHAFAERFGAWICQHYGTSETGAITNHLPDQVKDRPASVGRPLVGVRVTIVAPDDSPLTPGGEGEIVVESDAVARDYILGAPQGRTPFGQRRFWTGDVGTLDDGGYLTLSGRRDAMINVGGLKVAPAEVAFVLEQHPDVREAAVTGVPDGRGEEVVYAVVASDGAAGEAELVAFCRERLAAHKVPRRIEIRDELPRTASGKVRLRPDDFAR
jgi:long-chain acyl-CoA synthetase